MEETQRTEEIQVPDSQPDPTGTPPSSPQGESQSNPSTKPPVVRIPLLPLIARPVFEEYVPPTSPYYTQDQLEKLLELETFGATGLAWYVYKKSKSKVADDFLRRTWDWIKADFGSAENPALMLIRTQLFVTPVPLLESLVKNTLGVDLNVPEIKPWVDKWNLWKAQGKKIAAIYICTLTCADGRWLSRDQFAQLKSDINSYYNDQEWALRWDPATAADGSAPKWFPSGRSKEMMLEWVDFHQRKFDNFPDPANLRPFDACPIYVGYSSDVFERPPRHEKKHSGYMLGFLVTWFTKNIPGVKHLQIPIFPLWTPDTLPQLLEMFASIAFESYVRDGGLNVIEAGSELSAAVAALPCWNETWDRLFVDEVDVYLAAVEREQVLVTNYSESMALLRSAPTEEEEEEIWAKLQRDRDEINAKIVALEAYRDRLLAWEAERDAHAEAERLQQIERNKGNALLQKVSQMMAVVEKRKAESAPILETAWEKAMPLIPRETGTYPGQPEEDLTTREARLVDSMFRQLLGPPVQEALPPDQSDPDYVIWEPMFRELFLNRLQARFDIENAWADLELKLMHGEPSEIEKEPTDDEAEADDQGILENFSLFHIE